MAEQNALYKCSVCGNVVSVLEAHEGTLVCCGKEMIKQEPKREKEEGEEKHVPVVESTDAGIRVVVGSTRHPMEDKHFIELIQVVKDDEIVVGKRLKPGEEPVAEFCLANTDGLKARAFCNIHGLWVNY